ncbi:hypothetical protein PanWU01x14_196520 [Parasponia andersonii]|uniref:Uncharacterized protein n=1 Tax=Parasponia andersonii TaxID=3476 RepID=A0A2P5BZL9_PARAD|nr:hypothetical protein PanWU01x14_196520 [Parasponia andersonii]
MRLCSRVGIDYRESRGSLDYGIEDQDRPHLDELKESIVDQWVIVEESAKKGGPKISSEKVVAIIREGNEVQDADRKWQSLKDVQAITHNWGKEVVVNLDKLITVSIQEHANNAMFMASGGSKAKVFGQAFSFQEFGFPMKVDSKALRRVTIEHIGSKRKLSVDDLKEIDESKQHRASHGEMGDMNSSIVSASLEIHGHRELRII